MNARCSSSRRDKRAVTARLQVLSLAPSSTCLLRFFGFQLTTEEELMPKYLIERELPGAGQLSQEQLRGISQKSCSVLNKLGPQIQWIQSYVTGDKIYCVYRAPNEEMVREHAKQGGFPANKVSEITSVIDP